MDMFIDVHDRKSDQDLKLNILHARTFESKDEVDRQGDTHYLIIYALFNNGYLEEEFDSPSEREEKLEILDAYLS